MLRVALAFAIVVVLASAAACGLDHAGTGPVAAIDASVADASALDASSNVDAAIGCPPTSVTCGGACVTSCAGCDAGAALCPITRACGHCDKCAGYELECFACANATGPSTTFCSTPAQKCGVAAADHCPCTYGEPTDCPGAHQVCLGDESSAHCYACGEDGSENVTCANGLICVSDPMPPGCNGS